MTGSCAFVVCVWKRLDKSWLSLVFFFLWSSLGGYTLFNMLFGTVRIGLSSFVMGAVGLVQHERE